VVRSPRAQTTRGPRPRWAVPSASAPPGIADRDPRGPAALLQLGSIGLGLLAPVLARRLERRTTPARAAAVTAAALIAGGNLVTAWMERRHPYRDDWNRARPGELRADATYFAVQLPAVGAANSVLAASVPALAALVATDRAGRRWPTSAPLSARLALTLAVSELTHYWWHRFGHRAGWRWHAVHHSPDRLYWLNATKFHAIDMVVGSAVIALPLMVLGADPASLLAYSVFSGTFGKLQHANIAGGSGALNHVLATPDLHRWHHSTDPIEGASNFGARIILWDQVFRTRLLPPRTFDAAIGLADGPAVPAGWGGQALLPFRRPSSTTAAAAGV
jgi:sterol desaturase/sphingolipid hydroxylase (fatty acid hydroxylase superfamily)